MAKTKLNLKKLYKENDAFRLYVDKNIKSYGMTLEQAFDDAIIQSYAQYITQDNPKEVRHEVRKDCGC